MKDFFEILMKHWSQITLFTGVIMVGIGFIYKKKEITYDKIREAKLKELKQFHKSYINLETYLRDLLHASAQDKIDKEKEIRNSLTEVWNQFYLDFSFLRFFLRKDELVVFENLNQELEYIQLKLDLYKIERESNGYDQKLIEELRNIRDNIFPKRIPELLKIIENNFRKDFNIN